MGGTRILSDAQLIEMARLREVRGWSHARIAGYFTAAGTEVSAGSIQWQCLRVGADTPPHRRMSTECAIAMQRANPRVRPFTPEEDARLLELESRGTRMSDIGRAIGRRDNSVRARLMVLARRQARAEEAA